MLYRTKHLSHVYSFREWTMLYATKLEVSLQWIQTWRSKTWQFTHAVSTYALADLYHRNPTYKRRKRNMLSRNSRWGSNDVKYTQSKAYGEKSQNATEQNSGCQENSPTSSNNFRFTQNTKMVALNANLLVSFLLPPMNQSMNQPQKRPHGIKTLV